MTALIEEVYIVDHLPLKELLIKKDLHWESQGFDDSYLYLTAPLYLKSFEGSKKLKITIEEIT